MTTLSTHVLDTTRGLPAAGVAVVLTDAAGTILGTAVTDADGRIAALGDELPPGVYRLRFDTGACFAETFYPEVVITFTLDRAPHCHVPLLLSPFGYSTYRGS
ncbi:hydroxyisourate hydrolase [Nocardia stercoris]|uniref:5-hydroxyisourate hydrolase n=1 Tax=Nocardia stercoris TaxID=2483361 RepID=A0A3M2KZB0_9NOCA|nr:hydroxyisourate hydrolase [Nocardia stercoris]RMI30819.1 hydroxyisourate hydrolase [Nocardia stercoris]